MATTTVTSSGAGIGKIYPTQPMMSVSDTLFVFDLNPLSLDGLKLLCEETKWNTITVYQIQNWAKLPEFTIAVRNLIKYAIFKNQDLCDKVFIVARDSKFIDVANEIWPIEKRPIDKFRGREWPSETFAKHFPTTEGSGSVGQSPDKMDPNDIVSWFMEFEYEDYESNDMTLPLETVKNNDPQQSLFDDDEREDPTEDDLPYPLEDDAVLVICGEDPLITATEVRYWYQHQVSSFPLQESHAKPMNNLTAAFLIPQNTIKVDCRRMVRAEVWYPPAPEPGPEGGDDSGA